MTAKVDGGLQVGENIVSETNSASVARKRITPADVAMLRREIFANGIVSRAEADRLFALDTACSDRCAEWRILFVEAITDYIVHQEKPCGYISAENAEWLIQAVSHDDVVDTGAELELLVNVLEEAKFSPESLAGFALRQVQHAVVEAKGPLMLGGRLVPGLVGKAEVDLLRRILYAFGGHGNIAVTRSEAEVLIEINDSTAGAKNDPSWNDLFVKAVANYVMCASGYEAPTREEALRRDHFFDRADADIGGFFSRMVAGGVRGIFEAYRPSINVDSDWEARNRSNEARARWAETIDAGEARWLTSKIGNGRPLHENERALLGFIKQASPEIHPDLRPLLDKVA